MAANPNTIARKPISVRKPETAPQPQPSSVAELHEPSAATISAVTESAAQPSSGDELPDAANESSRHDDVARAAYYIAEARGFEPGHELDDWLAAEERIG